MSIKADDPKVLARVFAEHASNEKGDLLARVWEAPEFAEAHDYEGGYERKGMLKMKQETLYRMTDVKTKLFQKLYYNPELTEADELELRKRFVADSSSHDMRSYAIKWGSFLSFWPVLYFSSFRIRGWTAVTAVSLGWFVLYRQVQKLNNRMLQGSLNSFASRYADKYTITNHFD